MPGGINMSDDTENHSFFFLTFITSDLRQFSLSFLQRVNYLKSKKFSPEAVASMVSRAPYLLNFSVKRLDNRLGFFQQQLSLSALNVSTSN